MNSIFGPPDAGGLAAAMHWPVVYYNDGTAEPLRVFTRQDWCENLAARYALSHITRGQQFFVDCSERVYVLAGKGMISPGFQIIELEPADRLDVPELVRRRCQSAFGFSPGTIREIIDYLAKAQ